MHWSFATYNTGNKGFLLQIIAGYKTQFYHCEPASKWQFLVWHHMTSPRTKKFNSVLSAGKIMVTVSWDNKRCYSWQLPAKWTTVNSNRYAETQGNLNARLHRAHTQKNVSEVSLLHDNTKLHISVHTTKATIRNFEWTMLPHPPHNPELAQQITTCFVLWKQACKDTITPITRHCIMPHASGCREGRETFTR